MKELLLLISIALAPSATVLGQNTCRDSSPSNSEGLLVITRYSNGLSKSGFVDITAKVVVEPKYDEVYSFSDGLALVKTGDKYGFIDRQGAEVIKPQFENACSFSEGLASVKINGKYGYIDKEGTSKITPQFDNAFNFSEGLAKIKVYVRVNQGQATVEEQYGYIDKSGKVVVPAIFDAASDFRGGVARVVDSVFGLETYINKEGKIIARKSSLPAEGLGIGPTLVELTLESSPGGADIYLIPKRRIELDPALPGKDEDGLYEFKVPSGPTPITFKAKQKVFTALFILKGVRKSVPLDVRPDGTKSVKVIFQ